IAIAAIVSAPRAAHVPAALASGSQVPSVLASPATLGLEAPSAPAAGPGLRAWLWAAHQDAPHSRQRATGSISPAPILTRRPDWDAIAYCESHDQWNINAGTYWGGLQFAHSTWFAFGGGPFDGAGWFPYTREQQIAVAERVLAVEGPGAWPVCFRWASP